MNKDIIPTAKEGYAYKFGKSGWRQTKILTQEEKQVRGNNLNKVKTKK